MYLKNFKVIFLVSLLVGNYVELRPTTQKPLLANIPKVVENFQERIKETKEEIVRKKEVEAKEPIWDCNENCKEQKKFDNSWIDLMTNGNLWNIKDLHF